ncbi:MAG: hypothetical protein CK424_05925 [Legionella sp.]|nr:MAG: hypothetical protein CK424_05925 [Legionella sp.]
MKRLWMSVCVWLLCINTYAAGLSADLDALSVELGKTVRLTLSYDPSEDQGMPDLSELRADFTILATEQSMSYTVINGQARSVAQWSIVLEPKKAGILVIPALSIGRLSSIPLQVSVNAAVPASRSDGGNHPASLAKTDGPTLTADIQTDHPYLHQEILYTVRLLNRHRLMNVRYRAPHVDDAILFPLGQGREYQTTISGVLYHVDEQMYAIFPQKSGELTIAPPALHALIYDGTSTPISLEAKSLLVHVQPLPKQASIQTWLPSKLVRLREKYDEAATTLSQGATVVRSIRLQAQGLVAQLLPQITFEPTPGVSIYPEQAEKSNDVRQGELWGTTQLKITYVFTKTGTLQLPPVKVSWFNVKTKQFEVAELPAKTYLIQPKTTVAKPHARKVMSSPVAAEILPKNLSWGLKHGLWIFLLTGIILFAGVRCYRWRVRRSKPYEDVRDACLANDPRRAKKAIEHWATYQWPDKAPIHLADIEKLMDDPVCREHLKCLIAALYHPSNAAWQGKGLWHSIQSFKKPISGSKSKTPGLPPMNPTRKDS